MITARLFLPKNAKPPFQAVVYFPPASALFLRSSENLGSREFGFLVRSGRAVLFPVYQGTYERRGQNAVRGPELPAGPPDPAGARCPALARLPGDPFRHRPDPPRLLRSQHGRRHGRHRGGGGRPVQDPRPRGGRPLGWSSRRSGPHSLRSAGADAGGDDQRPLRLHGAPGGLPAPAVPPPRHPRAGQAARPLRQRARGSLAFGGEGKPGLAGPLPRARDAGDGSGNA